MGYVVALRERGVEGWVTIKQEVVEIPKAAKRDVHEGRFVDVFTEMLVEAMDMEDALLEARGLGEEQEEVSVVDGEEREVVGCKRAGDGDGEGDGERVKKVKVEGEEGSTAENFDDFTESFTTDDLATQSFMTEDFATNDLLDEDFTDDDFTDEDLVAWGFVTEGLADEDRVTENLAAESPTTTKDLPTKNLAT